MTACRRAFMRLSRQIIHRFLLIQPGCGVYKYSFRCIPSRNQNRQRQSRPRARRHASPLPARPDIPGQELLRILSRHPVRPVDGGDVVGHDVEKAAGAGAPVERRNHAALVGDVARRPTLSSSGASRRGRGRTGARPDRRGRSGDRSLRGLSTAGCIGAGAVVSGNSSDPGRPGLRPDGAGAHSLAQRSSCCQPGLLSDCDSPGCGATCERRPPRARFRHHRRCQVRCLGRRKGTH